MLQDLRFGLRMLLKQRTFALAAIIALAVGIGANTAIFSVVNAVLLRPLPYQGSDRLVLLWGNLLKFSIEQRPAKAAEYVDYRDQTRSFAHVAAFHTEDFTLTGTGQPARVAGASISANLFPMLGAQVAQGRLISSEEDKAGQNKVVILSHHFWQERLDGSASVVNSTLRLNDQSYTVIGVMPAGFEFPHPSFNFAEPVELWLPLTLTTPQIAERRGPDYLNVIALLKPNVSVEEARSEMTLLGQTFEQKYEGYRGPNNSDMGWRITVTPLQEQIVGHSRRALVVLFAAVGLVLLIACANTANLFLMRAAARQRELAIRSAIGAGRWRLIRQLLTESLLISGLGGVLGFALAWWGVKALIAVGHANLPRLLEINIDVRVLFFTIALSILTGLLFGTVPALQASKSNAQTLKAGAVTGGRGRRKLRNTLVVAEVALAMMLLLGAGLMVKSFIQLQRHNPLVDTDKLLSVEIDLPQTRYPDPPKTAAFFQELIRRVETLPGVEAVSLSTIQPLSGVARNDPFVVEGRQIDFNNVMVAGWQGVTAGHFQTLGIPIIAGRNLAPGDNGEVLREAVINEALARRYFPNENPIGRRLTLGLPRPDNPWLTIVGIVKDIPHRGLESKAEPDWYLPYLRQPRRHAYLMVRTEGNAASLATTVRGEISALDKDQPVTSMNTLREVIASTTAPRRFNTLLLSAFAVIALILAAVGIYSVISYSVSQRTQEIGVRMALGAEAGNVMRLIVRQGLTLTLAGITIGIVGTVLAGRAVSSLLYGVGATDPTTFAAISSLLLGVALLACYLPARRAAKVDPITSLRHE